MGRSRGVHNADDDAGHRSKRRRVAPTGDNVETAVAAQGTNEGKKALYHCNYCNKDITGKIRIKCTICPDFDLCVECFSVGAAVKPHDSIHTYRVMDNLSFPLIYPDWNADEEILLLEGIEMYGLGNWAEVAEHVGTKSKAQCIEHYTTGYMNSPCFPLPDMSHVVGKNRKELLAMAKGHGEGIRGFSMVADTPKEDSMFSPRIKNEEAAAGRSPSSFTSEGNYIDSKVKNVGFSEGKKVSNAGHVKKDGSDGIKTENMASAEESQLDWSIGVKKPKLSADEPMTVQNGYNLKRQEFDPEYDNDAEQPLAEIEFKDNDTDTERELKLRVLHIYYSRLDERKRRKNFILERNLLYPNPLEKELSPEDRQLYERCKVFMRFHTQVEHDEFVRGLIMEETMQKRLQELQECQAAGCRTMEEVDRYIAKRKPQESEACKTKESASEVPSSKMVLKSNRPTNREKGESEGSVHAIADTIHKIKGVPTGVGVNSKDLLLTIPKSLAEWDVRGLPGADLLTNKDVQLCCECRLLPVHYLKMQEKLAVEIFKGTVTHKSDAHRLFDVDPSKVDRVYDMLVRKGLVKAEEILAS